MFPDKAQHSSEDANYNSLDTQNSNPDRNRPEISNNETILSLYLYVQTEGLK